MSTQKRVLVIGGGLGGISAAISLAQSGYDVSLYEKNRHLGGKLNRLEKDGFGFDLGPSILTMPKVFERLFTGSGKRMSDYIPTIRLNHQWRSFFPGGNVIDLYENLHDMETRNPHLSKKDMRQFRKLLDYSKNLYETIEKGYFNKGLDTTREVGEFHGVLSTFKNFDLFSTVHEAIGKRISNDQFADMLSYYSKYVGSSPYDAPALLNMMIYMQQHEGAWYVPGGMDRIAQGLTKLGQEIGVKFHTGQAVIRLDRQDGRITGAVLEDRTKLTADYYVANMEVIPLYERLLQEDENYVAKLKKKFEPASSGMIMHLGVKKKYPQLAHHNFFFAKDQKKQMNKIFHERKLPDDPVIYLVNTNKTDPSQAPEGHENIKVLPHIPFIQDEPFTREDYDQFTDRVFTKLERMGLTDLRKNIVTSDIWTPEDIRQTYWTDRGAIYGTVSDKKMNKGFKHPKQSELYDNLYFAGGTVNPGGGMPMVTLSGQQVRDKIVERDNRRR
ncbi:MULTISPECIES: phytoene desaturase family protein [Sporosarcina]|uniref:phytoene desaturase family protein n=1 Tax=Sporosarcina TaxID=1569 RepID=UPI0009E63735|nr:MULTISPECIES: phytoene desaturase family protein [Sporosarcina]WJY28139.1 phytoene desaturase family protein [Sporosarcina sp. 0.2-SM1T-5]